MIQYALTVPMHKTSLPNNPPGLRKVVKLADENKFVLNLYFGPKLPVINTFLSCLIVCRIISLF